MYIYYILYIVIIRCLWQAFRLFRISLASAPSDIIIIILMNKIGSKCSWNIYLYLYSKYT